MRFLELCEDNLKAFGLFDRIEQRRRAIESSKLEHLVIRMITVPKSQLEFGAILKSVPNMHLKSLTILLRFNPRLNPNCCRTLADDCCLELAEAARRNGSLVSVRLFVSRNDSFGSQNDICMLNENSRRRLNKYAARNQGLARWSAAPESLPATAAFAHALAVAQVTGPSNIFAILVKALGPLMGRLLSHAGEEEEELDATVVARPVKRRHLSSPLQEETM